MGAPDALEAARGTEQLTFRPVRDSLRLAGGELVVHALRGLSTEGALAIWLPDEKFLWVGDYIQQTDRPSIYARDVVRSVESLRIEPVRFGAQHVPLGDWATIRALQSSWP